MSEIPVIAQLHQVVGTLTILAGGAALLLPKGRRLHKYAGRVFFITMLVLCFSGMYLTFARSLQFTFFLAIISLYMLLTGWYTMAKKSVQVDQFDRIGFYAICLIGIGTFALSSLGWIFNWRYPETEPSYPAYFVLFVFTALLARADYLYLKAQRHFGTQRLLRHLWRMQFSLLIATSIFFGGNADILPERFRTDIILVTPILTVIIFMCGWVLYIKLSKRHRTLEARRSHNGNVNLGV